MENETIMDIDINNLKQKQYEFLYKHIEKIFNGILKDLKKEDLQSVYNKLIFSPAGDGWGTENYYINFSYKKDEEMDLYDILEKMSDLLDIKIKEDK